MHFGKLDKLTENAISHALHCLLGCGIGEILGMVIAEGLGWHNFGKTTLAIVLAFVVGYSLATIATKKVVPTARRPLKAH